MPLLAIVPILQRVPFFAQLTAEQLAHLCASGDTRALPAGTTVFQQGDAAESMFVLLAGEPIAKPIFAWSHQDASQKGQRGLKRLLED